MTAHIKTPATKPAIQQPASNATTWIGNHKYDNKHTITGQTFTAPYDGDLESIEVFVSMVTTPGNVIMTLHSFDPESRSWGPVLGTATLPFSRDDNGKWKSFPLPGLRLNKGKTFGFRLDSPTCYIGVGESVGSILSPLMINGQEWKFTNTDQKGQSFSYFSLAFKVAVRA